jgi:hypothetical protein
MTPFSSTLSSSWLSPTESRLRIRLRHAGLALWSLDDYSMDMPSAKKPPRETLKPVAKLKRWHASLLRQRALPLGVVEAPDKKAAEAAAVKKFGLDDEQRMRLAVRAEQ